MSGAFFGVFQADHTPADAVVLAAMDRAMAEWGRDGGGLHTQGPVALGARILNVTFEDEAEQQPLRDGPHRLVARVRLDNRRELCARLGLINKPDLPDSRLILEAYRRFGTDCVQYLLGDWSFALWDEGTQTLLLARDACGNTGVHYWWDGKRLVFSNGIKAILAHPDFQAEPDPLVLAGILTVYVDPEVADAAIYKGIKKIKPGCLLLARQKGIQIERWWQPERLEPLHYARPEDCYADFVALYDEVVGECLRVGRGKVAATLSGGLDSSSVVALAAPRLQARGELLTAFTHAPLYEPTLAGTARTGDELALAQATADHVGNTLVMPVRSQDKTVEWGMRRALQILDAPGHGATHYYWLFDIQQRAQASGAKVLLTGHMGNATVSYNGSGNLWPALRRGSLGASAMALWQEEAGLWSGIKHRLAKPLLRPALTRWRSWRLDGPQPWAHLSLIHPAFAADLRLRERMLGAGFDPTFATAGDPNGARMRTFRLLTVRGGEESALTWMATGAATGLDVRDPTRDRRIVEFCWRLPDAAFWAKGRRRGLIRQGMPAHLPLPVLTCQAKGLQSSDLMERLRVEALALLDALEAATSHPLAAILDLQRIRQQLAAIKSGRMIDLLLLSGFGRALQVAIFLGQIKAQKEFGAARES